MPGTAHLLLAFVARAVPLAGRVLCGGLLTLLLLDDGWGEGAGSRRRALGCADALLGFAGVGLGVPYAE